ncbi:MAG: D-Ala-D-Ala carboxypeptidase family metallohydrolase [Pseudomonadota bacterium]|nr:D-Ala-D-Ala carboxypeptidase family metallohydrolase [Pseudomonadota bacterium]
MSIRLSPHFTLAEMTHSQTAARQGIDNSPTAAHQANLKQLCVELLEPIRSMLGNRPITVSSGYRSVALNAAVNGSLTSAHCIGFAVDFNCHSFGNAKAVATFLAHELPKRGIQFDQLILEFGGWVHLGMFNRQMRQRGQIMTFRMINGKLDIKKGII